MRSALTGLTLIAVGLAAAGPAFPQATTQATIRLSWNTCDPQRPDTVFAGPLSYRLVISVADLKPGYWADDSFGTDVTLAIAPEDGAEVPDAWRFDAAGCQTPIYYRYLPRALGPSCPVMVGGDNLMLSEYTYDAATRSCRFRVAEAYNIPFSPASGQRYTLWQIWFDMQHAAAGAGIPGEICGGAEKPIRIRLVSAEMLLVNGYTVAFHPTPGDRSYLRWRGEPPVATAPVTWGRVKDLYR
jgi:hypothetical protein